MTPLDQFQINETEKLIAPETEKGENSISQRIQGK